MNYDVDEVNNKRKNCCRGNQMSDQRTVTFGF